MIHEWLRRLWYLLNRRRFDAALKAEMEAHRAMTGEPARFGNVLRLREDAADVWGFRWLDDLVRDARLGARSLRRTPGFAFVAVASLALAIAVTAAATAIINAYFIRPLPYPAADRMYHVMYAPPGPWEPTGLSALDWTALSDVVELAMTSSGDTVFAMGIAAPNPSRVLRVSRGFLEGVGVRAALGRTLGGDDYAEMAVPPVMISQRLWRERFNSDPAAVGSEFQAEVASRGRAPARYRVVGILPQGFWYGSDSRDWVDVLEPLRTPARTYRVRLREGVPPVAAVQRITAAVRQIATDLPPNWPGVTLELARERYVARVRPILTAVGAATLLILGIACANLAVLTLLRALRRQKEIGVRLALGAGRGRIARMLLVESCVLVSIATGVGLALSVFMLALLGPTITERLDLWAPGGEDTLKLDATVVAIVSLLGVAIAGTLPLLALVARWRSGPAAALRSGGRSSTDTPAARRWRSALIVTQVAGSLALLVGSGLMIRSLTNMVRAEYGIQTSGLVRVGVNFPNRPELSPAALAARLDEIVARATAISRAPVPLFGWLQFAETPKQPVGTDASPAGMPMGIMPANAAYFDALQIALRDGRHLADSDRAGAEPVAVLSQTAARRLFPDSRAVGRRVRLADGYISGDLAAGWHTVVGVVADVRQTYGDRDEADIYVPLLRNPPARHAWFYMRTDEPVRSWEAALRQAIGEVDRQAWIRVAVPLPLEAARQWAAPGFLASLTSGFSAFAVLFAVLGIYGVTAFSLQQREREVAIRVALGATRARSVRMFLRDGGAVLATGLALGLLVAVGVGRALRAGLHDVGPYDPATFLSALLLLTAASVAAIWWPAIRAARRNPVSTLNAGE